MKGQRKSPNVLYVGDVLGPEKAGPYALYLRVVSVYPRYFTVQIADIT